VKTIGIAVWVVLIP